MLEAMGCGLPVIVSDASPGPLELVQDGETGLIFPVDDADGLAAAMRRLIDDEALRKRLGTAALQRASGMSPAAVAAEWEGLIASLGVDLAVRATR
jgi:glycosyltransferase involved in cell wall biosynthesis